MTKEEFLEIARVISNIAIDNRLSIDFKPDFNDELDFVTDLKTEAIDYKTLENPTCINVCSYLVVTLPKVVTDETEPATEYDSRVSEYNYVANQLMMAAKPQYLLGVKDGRFVEKLMWCIWF